MVVNGAKIGNAFLFSLARQLMEESTRSAAWAGPIGNLILHQVAGAKSNSSRTAFWRPCATCCSTVSPRFPPRFWPRRGKTTLPRMAGEKVQAIAAFRTGQRRICSNQDRFGTSPGRTIQAIVQRCRWSRSRHTIVPG
jgi:hypothetical protein